MPTPRGRFAREPLVLLALTAVALIVSGVRPYDRTTWVLEGGPPAQVTLARVHDRELARLNAAPGE